MKQRNFLVATFCLLIAANVFAQLRVRPQGTAMLGTLDFELNNPFPDLRDTTTMLKIFGPGHYYGEQGRLSFGDQLFSMARNVMLGEAGSTNTDQLWLHGRNGLCATFDAAGNDTLFSYFPLDEDLLAINSPMRSSALYLTSDERLKENVEHIGDALSVVSALNGVSYRYKSVARNPKTDAVLDQLAAVDPTGSATRYKEESDQIHANRTDQSTHYGFIAQEVEQVLPELVHTGKDGMKSVDYIAVIPLLVNAIQELQAQLAEVKGDEPLKAPARAPQTTGTDDIAAGLAVPALYQNTPNPFTADTQIRYSLPESVLQADLYVYDLQGKQVKHIVVSDRGQSSVTIHGSELQAGMYIYALIADGQEVASKRMILTK